MKTSLFFCFLFGLLLLSNCEFTPPQEVPFQEKEHPPIRLKVFTNQTKIKMGEDFTYHIEVLAKKEFDIEFPDFGSHLQKEFAIRGLEIPDPEELGPYRKYQQIYTINCYTIGNYTIAPTRIRYVQNKEETAEKKELSSPEIFIEILSPLKLDEKGNVVEQSEDIEDIESVLALPAPKRDYSRIWIASAITLFFLFLLFGFIFRKKAKEEKEPPIPPHLLALKELKKIQSLNLVAQKEYKEYYNRVSFVLRTYLENRFGLHAPERTTPEFVQEMVKTDCLTEAQKEQLRLFLMQCDLVKFAKNVPSESQCNDIFQMVLQFIETTKQVSETDEDNDEDEDNNEDEQEEKTSDTVASPENTGSSV